MLSSPTHHPPSQARPPRPLPAREPRPASAFTNAVIERVCRCQHRPRCCARRSRVRRRIPLLYRSCKMYTLTPSQLTQCYQSPPSIAHHDRLMKLIAWNHISIGSTGRGIAAASAALAAAARVVRRGGFCDGGGSGSGKAFFASSHSATIITV